MEKTTMIPVTNRHSGTVFYQVPDNYGGLTRRFNPGETKEIAFGELEQLSWTPGGAELLKRYLVLKNEEAVRLLLGEVEPEYYYSEKDIKNLLLSGSLEQLLDCLEFANEGAIEILKVLAVEYEVPDVRKRQAIFDKTGFDINTAIEHKHYMAADAGETASTGAHSRQRRAAPITETPAAETPVAETTTKERKAEPFISADKYKVIS